MKKIFVLLMFAAFGTICSCQKQDSTADEQLTQRKLQLDAREEALAEGKSVLDERKKALDERERALQQREKSLAAKGQGAMNAQTSLAEVQAPAQTEAENDSEIQQLSSRLPDIKQAAVAEKADKEREIQGAQQSLAPGETQNDKTRSAAELDREKQRIMDALRTSPAPH